MIVGNLKEILDENTAQTYLYTCYMPFTWIQARKSWKHVGQLFGGVLMPQTIGAGMIQILMIFYVSTTK